MVFNQETHEKFVEVLKYLMQTIAMKRRRGLIESANLFSFGKIATLNFSSL